MEPLRNAWKDDLKRQGKTEQQIAAEEQEQQASASQLEAHLEHDEAVLVSLHRMGARFELISQKTSPALHAKVLLLLAIQFAISRIPALFGLFDSDAFFPYFLLNLSFLVFPFLAIYLCGSWNKQLVRYLGMLALLCVIVNIQQANKAVVEETTFILSTLHLPLFGILSLAIFQTQETYTQKLGRHLRLVGEVGLLTFLLCCACFVVMLLAVTLFEAVGIRIEDRVATFLVTSILPLLPLLAVHLITLQGTKLGQLTRLLASLFLPVFTVMMLIFLAALALEGIEIKEDRTLLLAIDLLLALLLLMILYATDLLEEEQNSRFWRMMVLVSSITALVLDCIALAAIGTRLLSYGVSANRLAVLAENLLLFANLVALVVTLGRRRSTARIQAVFLSIYAAWFSCVILLFPIIF
ncbi:MAG: DUF4153 domain-containing protein [Spirochaetales bacterium]|jgi:hypothetical protein|nr:DUF4153 domain-containing protein [Spirochaetales bacterium]